MASAERVVSWSDVGCCCHVCRGEELARAPCSCDDVSTNTGAAEGDDASPTSCSGCGGMDNYGTGRLCEMLYCFSCSPPESPPSSAAEDPQLQSQEQPQPATRTAERPTSPSGAAADGGRNSIMGKGMVVCSDCAVDVPGAPYCPGCLAVPPPESSQMVSKTAASTSTSASGSGSVAESSVTVARAVRGRCTRCCGCPVCGSVMVFRVVGGGGGESTGASRAVYLNCGHCRFSTAESGLVAANPEELMNEIMRREDIPELRTAFSQTSELCIAKSFTEAAELYHGSRHLDPPITFYDLNEMIARKREDLAKPSRADNYIMNAATSSIIAQSDPTDCFTLEQKLNHGSGRKLLPQRMLLRSTRTKLCPSCKSVLVKPSIGDAKPPSRQHFAWNYLPHITISQVKFTTDTSISATLIFSNTSPRLLQVSACSGKLNKSASLAIESRSFTLDADDPTPTVAACHSPKRVCLPVCIELHSLNKLGYMVSVDLEVNFELTFKQNAPVQQQQQPQIFRIPQAVKTTYLLKFKIDNRN